MSKIYQEISDEELKSLTAAIKNRYGVDFTNYETKSLKRGFDRLISSRDLGSILGLWSKILRDREFFLSCIDDLTVNLTELFRNPELWLKIKDDLLEQLKSKPQLNMWHAGCSTGEEVYTMAIVLNHISLLHKTNSLATDLSSRVLAKAIEGCYSDILIGKYTKSFNKFLPNGNIENDFLKEEKGWRIKDKLKKHIEFKQHNLAQDKMLKQFDIIFCRNVMIYFDDTLKMNVLKLFYDSLPKDGFLIIGYYDMLPADHTKYFEIYDSTTKIYRRK